MQRSVELAVSVAAVNDVNALGRLVISLPCLRADRIASERNLVRLEYLTRMH